MKIKNSAKWSNLYSTELKSDYIIQPSLMATELLIGLCVVCISFFHFNYFEKAIVVWQLIAMTFLGGYFCYVLIKKNFLLKSPQTLLCLDGYNGTAIYQGKCYQISSKSRVGLLGGYLTLIDASQTPSFESSNQYLGFIREIFKGKLVFIDKRLVNAQQFSTLCFTLKKLHYCKDG